ncbi:MAG: hypothetical protein KGL39_16900 [Patescibacteria group bacterium]|nr:hypothetical protein [Patescibacteria group bacterium]
MRDKQLAASLQKWNGFSRGVISSQKPNQQVCLSEILEYAQLPDRYYLSPKACAGILRRAEKRGKELPALLARALNAVADSGRTSTSGGGLLCESAADGDREGD